MTVKFRKGQIYQGYPKDFKAFEKWHKLACPKDKLTAKERFNIEEGIEDEPVKSTKK